MATKIQLRRSVGSALPSSLAFGELAHISGIGSFGGSDQYKDRPFIGHDDISSPNIVPVGGRYYTSMMEHTPGSIAAVTNNINSDGGFVAVLDSDRKVDLEVYWVALVFLEHLVVTWMKRAPLMDY